MIVTTFIPSAKEVMTNVRIPERTNSLGEKEVAYVEIESEPDKLVSQSINVSDKAIEYWTGNEPAPEFKPRKNGRLLNSIQTAKLWAKLSDTEKIQYWASGLDIGYGISIN